MRTYYDVEFYINLIRYEWKDREYVPSQFLGKVKVSLLPFIPWSGMFIGSSQLITVGQVYFLPSIAHNLFRVDCAAVQDPFILSYGREPDKYRWSSFDAMIQDIKDISGYKNWIFEDVTCQLQSLS